MELEAQPRAAVSGDEEGLAPGVPSTSTQLTRLEVSYPRRFKAFVASAVIVAQLWVLNLFLVDDHDSGGGVVELEDCDYDGALLRRHVMVLSAFFACFAAVRALVFVPSLAVRVVEARLGLRGPCWDGAATAVLHAPLYIFTIGSWVLWILTLARCYFVAEFSIYFNHASYGCLVSLWCLCLARWHGILLSRASRVASRRAPPNTIHTIPTISYDPALFGDEDGKHYPGECPICLLDWEDEDSIKLTSCGHVFHEECLGLWLDQERSCAICRQDISTALKLSRADPVPATGGAGGGGGGGEAELQLQSPGESSVDRLTSDGGKADSQTWTSSGSISPRRDCTPRREARHRQLLEAAANSEQIRRLSRSAASSSGSGSNSPASSWFRSQRRQQSSPDQSEVLPEQQSKRVSQTSAGSGGNRSRLFMGGSIPLTMELVSLALGSHSTTAAHCRESRQVGRRISGSSSLAAHSRELRSQAVAPAGRSSARSESTVFTACNSCGSAEPHAHGAAPATSVSPRISEGGPSGMESGLHVLPTFTV